MQHHLECLQKFCRICGTIIVSHRVTYLCSEHIQGIREGLKVCVEGDDPEIHPSKFCNNCYRAISRRGSSVMPVQWEGHADQGCETCSRYNQKAKGGRPKKRTRRSNDPVSITSSELLQHTGSLLPQLPSLKSQKALHPNRFMPPLPPVSLDDFTCPVCCMVLDQPVETVCGHIVCQCCLSKWLHVCDHAKPSCPCCPTQLNITSDIKPVTRVVQNILAGLQVKCDHNRCSAVMDLANLRQHMERCSPDHAAQVLICSPPLLVPSDVPPSAPPSGASTPSLKSIIESPLDKPPSAEELRAFTHVAKRMMNAKGGESEEFTPDLQLPTGGQVCTQHICTQRCLTAHFHFSHCASAWFLSLGRQQTRSPEQL